MRPLNSYIDHTLLKAAATQDDMIQLFNEAMEHDFYAVCINGCFTAFAKACLKKSIVKVATVVGFPLGAMSTAAKVYETEDAIKNGTDEIDMVLNVGALKAGDLTTVENDIAAVRAVSKSKVLKVIFENCFLTDEEKRIACQICLDAGVDFIKTSTGFGSSGATVEDVRLMKEAVGNRVKIKASGGLKDKETALQYIHLGVDRIGTSSGIKMMK